MDDGMSGAGGAEAQAKGAMQGTANLRQEQLAQTVPEADEPLEPSALNSLTEAIRSTIESVTAGQIDGADVNVAEVADPQDRVPADLWKYIVAIQGLIDSFEEDPAVEKYKFSAVDECKDNAGLTELAGMVDQLGRDRKAIRAISSGKKPPEHAGEEAENEPPHMGESPDEEL